MEKNFKEQYRQSEKGIAEAFEKIFNGGMNYKENAEYFTRYAHRYIQNEAFCFMLEVIKAMAKSPFDARNRFAHSMAKKIAEYLENNDFVYEDNANTASDSLIPYKDYKGCTSC